MLFSVTDIDRFSFEACLLLRKMILGHSSVVTLKNVDAFGSNTATTQKPLNVYVFRSLISEYQEATNWSEFYTSGRIIFKPIDTETLSGDGTTTAFTLTATTDEVFYIKIGNDFPEYTYDSTTGVITFVTAPASGTNNIEVYFKGVETV